VGADVPLHKSPHFAAGKWLKEDTNAFVY